MFFSSFSAIVFVGILTGHVCSQSLNNIDVENLIKQEAPQNNSLLQPNLISKSPQLHRNEIPSKAIRNFLRDYKEIADAKWFKLTHENNRLNGFRVVFTLDMVNTMVFYDKKGNYNCSFRYYWEDKLPQAIRHRVKTVYYDFDIGHIAEMNINDKTIYIITVEDKTCWKVIEVAEGKEMVIVKEYTKS